MSNTMAQIKDLKFFSGLKRRHLEVLAALAKEIEVEKGTYIFREGDDALRCLVVLSGDVALELPMQGRDPRTVQTVHDGDVLGWSWLYPPHRWTFDARAVTDVTALVFDAEQLRAVKDSDHELGFQLMTRFGKVMVSRLQATRMRLMDLYGNGD
ncbi:MAG: cyclic nucleotide-binding domain-containing protein [Acidimicrobiia bacterium]|nr:cyclic nucleotide-binding domain-containing protein [Acidimicrobiia bacterium]NNF69358.1 cyclic nucleotide-binding domain-containing protein [Acidimicrobiia bacterium]